MKDTLPEALRWSADGTIPCVVIDAATGEVLTLAYMNRDSLARTRETGETVFWSRSRGQLWHKGETSGNTQTVVSLAADCDGDAIIARVSPAGPACHRDTRSCWDSHAGGALVQLDDTLASRARALAEGSPPEGSYAAKLLGNENLRLKKIGEEAVELVHATLTGPPERVAEEAADLIFHVAAVLHGRGLSLADAMRVLESRARG
jgi:phosphoribosyl-ATP pyrophosphohydrolase/phosphoribosyl-AMP cyclohydrolase